MRWSLNALYESFESKKLQSDLQDLEKKLQYFVSYSNENFSTQTFSKDSIKVIENYILNKTEISIQADRLGAFARLSKSVDASNTDADKLNDKLENLLIQMVLPDVKFSKWICEFANDNKCSNFLNLAFTENKTVSEHEFILKEIIANGKYILSEKEEDVLARMEKTGSTAWEKLVGDLTSSHLVDIEINGEKKSMPLPEVRNMAYSSDASLRKTGYIAELNSYQKINTPMTFCLNSIKGEALEVAKIRGYKSLLDKTLINMRMNEETLNAMFASMKKSLPKFREYFRKKALMMGHENGLPFFDMFAPLGKNDKTFTYDEARDYIVEKFANYSSELSDFAKKAFDENWIDAEIRKGKRGGAFCANLRSIKESRVLSNFNGSFSNVTTLAHELGHAFHGKCLDKESILNTSYRMQVAETASIFCETIVMDAAKKDAVTKDEKLAILESELSDAAQVIVDIYSRFLFESKFCEIRKDRSLSVAEINALMIDAQKEAYGNGLDEKFLHESMWVCKPHYYSAGNNFYNFPYAFGLLFSKGLYAIYLEKGSAFLPIYNALLANTGKMSAENVAMSVGIDITKGEFWDKSMSVILKNVDEFVNL